ncbi:MAG: sigma-70 region 4 domain-containing protein [Myxococcaceae bacterium]|nr:sigma-70 region 4 domain-containing protein [Myxococcaceae bacterium]
MSGDLNPLQRNLLALREGGLTPTEIARKLILPLGTVNSALHRARARSRTEEEWCTPRMAEVLDLPITPYRLVELVRAAPRGGCVVCWRDVYGAEALACTRRKPGSTAAPCSSYVRRCREAAYAAQERAKASLFGEAA